MAAKTKDYEALKGLSPDQLKEELTKLKKEQFNLRFQKASGQLENTGRVRIVRRQIARVTMLIAAKQKTAAAPAGARKAAR